MGATATLTADPTGQPWVDLDDHGAGRRLRWKRRTRARAIAYLDDPTRRHQESNSPLKRLKTCGLAKAHDVTIKINDGRAHPSGLLACGNIWTCPTCSARIRARRETEIENALNEHVASGGTIGMMTLTLQHDKTMPLIETIERLNHAWNDLQGRRRYRTLHLALTGTIATMEITTGTGNAGWHPHLHILLLAGPDTTPQTIQRATSHLHQAWSNLANKTTTKYSLEHGLNLTWFGDNSHAAATYVTKLAKEITLTDTKTGNDPFSLLDDDEPQHLAMFMEYAHATYGRQAHRWSHGLRKALTGGDKELTDEELADQNDDLGHEALTISAELWNSITDNERLAWIEFCEAQHLFSSA